MPLATSEAELKAIMQELFSQSDRGCGIIGSAIVEDALTDLLKARLIGGASHMERLFSYEKNGPMSVFSAKIDMAFAVGAVDMKKRTTLHAIRKIRNRFAHNLQPLTFADPKIKSWCDAIATAMPDTNEPRHKFISGVGIAAMGLIFTTDRFPIRLKEVRSTITKPEWDDAFDAAFAGLLETSPEKLQ